ncbi:hypothetical protein EI94DRAFT_1809033 [Lactarius quietus]|nr:hypothetical protein EI94DRAFT_1823572 [Lactarius quietus]KAF8257144.1 hypothetical protein EI94DRAFT_1818883 [Lactarius quietus]KAF8262253.1 hypothetical protein EI94DRAFT_1809033 [Lactarius quietus]
MSQQDAIRDLNNYLQLHPRGNLTVHLSWAMTESGPPGQLTHSASAKFQGQAIGHGRGILKNVAKAEAAVQALQYLRQNHPY